jgi:DNA-binding GntR family transcriptional regulator
MLRTILMASSGQPRPGSLADEAYAILKLRIIRCELEPGRRITEAQLVATTGIGKTPVRKALARLVHENLVRNIPRHGYEVTPITLRAVQDHYGLRLIVEPAAVRMAASHVEASQLRRLEELAHVGYVVGDPESVTTFLRANREFQMIIAHASGNRPLRDLIEKLLDESERMQHLGMMIWNRSSQAAHEH